MTWFNVQHGPDSVIVRVHGELGTFGIGAPEFIEAVGDVQKVELRLDVPGGCALVAFKCADFLRQRNVTALVTNRCHSAGLDLLLAARHRECFADSTFLIHQPQIACYGHLAELREAIGHLERARGQFFDLLAKRTNASEAQITEWLANGDHYLTAQEALALGIVHAIVPRPAPLDVPAMAPSEPPAPDMHPSESLLRDMLRTLGEVRTTDKPALGKYLADWFQISVKG